MILGQTWYLPAASFYSSGDESQGGTFCREREQGEIEGENKCGKTLPKAKASQLHLVKIHL